MAAARSIGAVARRSPPAPIAGSNADTAAALSAAAATAARREPGPAESSLAVATPAAPPPEVSPRAQVPQVAASADDLTRIRGIDQALQARLNAHGVRTHAHIAAWHAEDVERISTELNLGVRIARENWIEQAQILAGGGETAYTLRKLQPEPAPAEPAPSTVEQRVSVPLAAAAAAAAAAARAPGPSSPPPPPSPGGSLRRIADIDAELEQRLADEGVTTYAQIAAWGPGDVVRFDRVLGLEGRIANEYWVEQAAVLARGGETAFSRIFDRMHGGSPLSSIPPAAAGVAEPEAPAAEEEDAEPAAADRPQRSDISVLRSVKSEAYRPADAPAEPDDLKRIRGIGLLIEKRLNAMGITRYEQIANWTSADIERVSSKLEFKGRIERENWIEQARILASGGQTEFSRRIDRGEVEKRG
jgi:predicted flap endonuclease-1-like 5' DNA nuclease